MARTKTRELQRRDWIKAQISTAHESSVTEAIANRTVGVFHGEQT